MLNYSIKDVILKYSNITEEDSVNSFSYSLLKELESTIITSTGKNTYNSYNAFIKDFIRERLSRFSKTRDINNKPVNDVFPYKDKNIFIKEVLEYFYNHNKKLLNEYKELIIRTAGSYFDQK